MAQTIAKEKAKDKRCHFHGRTFDSGKFILRIYCEKCHVHEVVYACDQCTHSIHTYAKKGDVTVRCTKCNHEQLAQNYWAILGEA